MPDLFQPGVVARLKRIEVELNAFEESMKFTNAVVDRELAVKIRKRLVNLVEVHLIIPVVHPGRSEGDFTICEYLRNALGDILNLLV